MGRVVGIVAVVALLTTVTGCHEAAGLVEHAETRPRLEQERAPAPGRAHAVDLSLDLGEVVWTKTSEHGNATTWVKTGARVRLTCSPSSIVVGYEAAQARDAAPDPDRVCDRLRGEPRLLTATDRRACDPSRYFHSTVRVHGTAWGRAVALDLETCEPLDVAGPVDAAQRWLALLDMAVPGPDPPG